MPFDNLANFMMTELDSLVNESELEPISINDFIPQYTSPFALVLQNLDQTFDLNSLINCTEDEQRNLIGPEIQFDQGFHLDETICEHSSDKDSEQCFFRIDPKIRKQLIKRHIPLVMNFTLSFLLEIMLIFFVFRAFYLQ